MSGRRVAPLVAVVVIALLASGCGGGSGARQSPAQFRHDFIAFAACMRSHGLSGYPDPRFSTGADGLQVKISPGALNPDTPAFRSADGACHQFLARGGLPNASSAAGASARAESVRFANCMRSHGVPSFPDPDRHGAFELPSQINPSAPAFVSANTACASVRPTSLVLDTRSG